MTVSDAEAAWVVLEAYATGVSPIAPQHGVFWPAFQPLVEARRGNRPMVVAQLGQSLDGRIATRTGHSHYINGPAALDHLHGLRAIAEAVVVGAGTVRADDPRLTVRRCPGRDPARVVIDPRGTVGPEARVWAPGARRLVVGGAAGLAGVERLPDPAPAAVRDALAARGLTVLLIEGGARTVGDWIAAGLVDRLHLLVGPLLIGSGLEGLRLPPIDRLEQALRPQISVHPLPGGDLLIDCDLRVDASGAGG